MGGRGDSVMGWDRDNRWGWERGVRCEKRVGSVTGDCELGEASVRGDRQLGRQYERSHARGQGALHSIAPLLPAHRSLVVDK